MTFRKPIDEETGMTPRVSSARLSLDLVCMAAALMVFGATTAAAQSDEKKMTKAQAVQLVFKRFDSNKDGNITNAEFMKVGERDFQAFDADKDGSVSKEEFLDPEPRRVGNASVDELAQAKKIWSQQFDMLDTDKNGVLSEAEHQKAGKRSFARIDTNKDNEITLPEMTAAAK
jgi:Ca2+-binding EF-hand superfamily protein